MKTILTMVVILFLSFNLSYAADEWDKDEKMLLGISLLSTSIDCAQTREIVKEQKKFESCMKSSHIQATCYNNNSLSCQFTNAELEEGCLQQTNNTRNKQLGEINPIIGEEPTMSRVDNYMISYLIVHTVLSNYLDHKWRKIFLTTVSIVELNIIDHNYRAGIRIKF